MGTVRLITTAFLLAVLLLAGSFSAQGMTDEEAKRAFLRSRGQLPAATPAPTPKARPKPKPARRKSSPEPSASQPSRAAATPRPTPAPTPEPAATPEPRTAAPPKAEPTPAPRATATPRRSTPAPGRKKGAILIEKSGGDEDRDFLPPPPSESRGFLFFRSKPKYKYLTPAVRNAIDKARVRKNRWRYIVVHNSGTRQGNAKAFEYYHRNVRKMPNGMAYHFVIGNGASSTGNGEIEIGSRWRRQINGGHVHSDFLNNIALGICFVGDYNRDQPTRQQLEALDELIRYLRRRVGKTQGKQAIVRAHKDINPRPTDCPGKKFPYTWLYTRFD